MARHPSGSEALGFIDQLMKKEFESNRRVLSFEEYLHVVGENPDRHLRGSAKFLTDMMDHYGRESLDNPAGGSPLTRFKVFDQAYNGSRKIVGQELVQDQIYSALKTFTRQGLNNKLLLLHGPNGSAKTSIAHGLMAGMERYSKEPEGAVYSINWIFPVDKITKGRIGLGDYAPRENLTSFAKLPDDEIVARIPCDLHDHPLLLLPVESRREFLEKLLGQDRLGEIWGQMPHYLTQGAPSHRNKQIFDALLTANGGDLRKVLMHVQVERFYYSRRYREGLVTIEPQLHVDAHAQQLTQNRSIGALPPALHGLNLFSLSGDLIEGNRGVVEFSDLLKRPVDSFKYLLVACETNAVNVGSTIAHLDTVMIGSTNELQLDAFKEFPDFNSFKARIELIRVPYLLEVRKEQEIYQPDLETIRKEKSVAPHVDWTLALWAVLTRLKKPNSINYPPNISTLVSNLTPLEKAKLYDTGEMPMSLAPEERKVLRSSLRRIREEYTNIPYYEGRIGASAREMRSILFSAAQNPDFKALTPLAVMREMEEFVKRVSEYEFLKQDVKDGYHDAQEFIAVTRNEYLAKIDREVRDSIGLYESTQWEDFLKKYVGQISLVVKKEKQKNAMTGKMEDPDFTLISEFERIVEAPSDGPQRDSFRQNIISQVGAWSLDHPGTPMVYAKVFPEFWTRLEKHYYESQKALLTKMHNALLIYDPEDASAGATEEGMKLARKTVENMKKRLGYCDDSAKEVITFLMSSRY